MMPRMTLADELLSLIEQRLGDGPVPRVRAVHLPPWPGSGSKDGEFGAVELDSGALGLSYLLLDDTLAALAGHAGTGGSTLGHPAVLGSDALALARRWRDGQGAGRALGFAAVNALSRHILDREGRVPPDAPDSIAGLDPQPGEHIGMVGLFPPLLKQVAACGAHLTVLELRADLLPAYPDLHVTLDPAALHRCSKVLLTSTVLLNDTLDTVLQHCRHAHTVAMIGPGAACLPEPLWARGVTVLGGTWIEDGAGFAQALRDGAPWGRFARKVVWRQADARPPPATLAR